MKPKKKKGKKIKVSFHYYKKIKCQGKKELRFLKEYERKYKKLLTKPKRVSTIHGFYTPDFEDSSYLYEVKSHHTFKVCIGEITYKNLSKETSDLQFKKIKELSRIKPIKIIIYFSSKEKIINYDKLIKGYNIQIVYKGGYKSRKSKSL